MAQENPISTCPQCSHANAADAKFCQNCGQKLERVCPNCSTINTTDAKFCKECGEDLAHPRAVTSPDSPHFTEISKPQAASLDTLRKAVPDALQARIVAAGANIEGQRKPVTILFTDIVSSTSLAERLDPEEWREIVSGAHRLVGDAVYRYEGTIAQLLGDGVLAFFGAPLTHEDDPARAVRAALDIQAAMEQYRQELLGLVDDFQMRIGINTGEVVVGSIGHDMHMEYLALGDAVNMAARLQSAAEPGGILISEVTSRLVESEIEVESLGDIEMKGKAEPQAVFRVLDVSSSPGRVRGLEGMTAPLVGRAAEMEQVHAALQSLGEGQGQILFILGEAGIGKSRLTEEARRIPLPGSNQHAKWLECRSLSYGGSLSYWPVIQLLQDDLGVSERDPHARVRVALRRRIQGLFGEDAGDTLPYLAHLLGLRGLDQGPSPVDSLDGESLKRGLHQALRIYFSRVAEESPLVLVFEDLHWADPSSVEIVEALLPLTDRAQVMIICVARPNREHPSWALRFNAETDLGHRYHEIQLEPLTVDNSIEMVDGLLQEADMPRDVQRRLLERSEGNPFYLEELIRSLIETGALARQNGGWALVGGVEQIHIPDTLQGVLLARIDALDEDVRQTLQLASVIGRSFLYRTLEEVSEDDRFLDDHLYRLQRADLVREQARQPDREYVFKHALTQEAAYNSVLLARRKQVHQQVGEIFETSWPDRQEELYGILAYHFDAAGDHEKAVSYLLKSGDRARALYAHQEAIKDYRRAIDILKEAGDTEQAGRTLMKLGLAYQIAFEFDLAQKAFEEAFALSDDSKPQPAPEPGPEPVEAALNIVRDYEVSLQQPTLDPAIAVITTSQTFIYELFSGLVEMRWSDLELVPDIAQSWEIEDGGQRYIFNLRDDVYWTDGTRVTAHDFVYSWKRVLDPELDSPIAYDLFDIAGARAFNTGQGELTGIHVLDDYTLEITLERPLGYFLQSLTNTVFFPVPKQAVEKYGDQWTAPENIITNGPFLLKAYESGEKIILDRNPDYWGSFPGNVDRYEMTKLVDPDQALTLYRRGALDILDLDDYPNEVSSKLTADFSADYSPSRQESIAFLRFNADKTPLDDLRMRQAFIHALDIDSLLGIGWPVNIEPAYGGLIPPAIPGHSAGISLGFNPDRARELLAQAGYPNGDGLGEVKLVAAGGFNSSSPEQTAAMAAAWKDVLGVDVVVVGLAFEQFLKARKESAYDILVNAYVPDFLDPEDIFRFLVNKYGDQSDEFKQSLKLARRETDQTKRLALYRDVDRLIIESGWAMPLTYGGSGALVKGGADGLRDHNKGLKYIEIAPRPEPELQRVDAAPNVIRDYDAHQAVPIFDPGIASDTVSHTYIQELFSGLVETRLSDLELSPDVARSWNVEDAGQRYIFQLRDDFYWSDGVQVTAGDFAYAWKRVLDPALDSPVAYLLFDLAGAKEYNTRQGELTGVRVLDDFTLEVELEQPAGYFLQLLANPAFLPVPQHAVEAHGEDWTALENIVTNGPMLLETFQPEKEVVLVRNPGYRGNYPGNVDRHETRSVTGPEEAIDLYRRGQIDGLYLWPYAREVVEQLVSEFADEYSLPPTGNLYYLSFQSGRPPFDDLHVRQAFIHALDADRIVGGLGGDGAVPAYGGLIPPALPGHSPDIGLKFDPDRARDLLAQAAYPGGVGLPVLKLLASERGQDVLETRIATSLKDHLGVEVEIHRMPLADTMEAWITSDFDIIAGGYTPDFMDPEDAIRFQIRKIGYEPAEIKELLGSARRETDQHKRLELYGKIDQILIETAHSMPLAYHGSGTLVKPWARGLRCCIKDLKYLEVGPRAVPPPADIPDQVLRDYYIRYRDEFILDPGLAYETLYSNMIEQVFSGLVDLRQSDLAIIPDVARSWDIQEGGKRLVFNLRDDFYWSDGVQVTAHDFAYAWNRVLDPALKSPTAHLLFDLAGAQAFHEGQKESIGVRVLDDFTLEVELEKPASYFLQLLTSTAFMPVPRHVVEQYGEAWTEEGHIVTNGPFLLQGAVPERGFVLVRNPRYPGEAPGGLARFEYLGLDEPEDAIDLYRRGEVDVLYLYLFSPEVEKQLVEEYTEDFVAVDKSTVYYLQFDLSKAPFNDPRLRQALAYAVDLKKIVGATSGSHSVPALGGLIPPALPGHSSGIGLPYDPERARRLLAEAGFLDGIGFPKLELVSFERLVPIAEELAQAWDSILGIQVDVVSDGQRILQDQKETPFTLKLTGQTPDFNDPEDLIRLQEGRIGFESPEFNEVVEMARTEMAQAKRLELYRHADRILIEEAVVLPVTYYGSNMLSKPWARGMRQFYKALKYLQGDPRPEPLLGDQAESVFHDYYLGLSGPNLDPGLAYDTFSHTFINELFRGLVEQRHPNLEVVPDIARSWEILDSGQKYIFHLVDDSYWSDGVRVTAHDFVYAWQRALDPALNSPAAHLLFDIAGAKAFHEGQTQALGVRAIDQFTLEVELEQPVGYFLQLLTNIVYKPVPRHLVEKHGASWTEVGKIAANGAFFLESQVDWEKVILARNPDYPGMVPGNVERWETRILPNQEAAAGLYRRDELDILYPFFSTSEKEWRVVEEFREDFAEAPKGSVTSLRFNLTRSPFNDPRVRLAFAHAIDKDSIVEHTMHGLTMSAHGGLVPPGIPGHLPGVGAPYDPKRARQLLQESGFVDSLELAELKLHTHVELEHVCKRIVEMWAENLDVHVEVDAQDFEVFLAEKTKQQFAMSYSGHAPDYYDPEDIFRMQEREIGYAAPDFAEVLGQARRETDQKNRIALYQQADRLLLEAAAVVPVDYHGYETLNKPWARGIRGIHKDLKYHKLGAHPTQAPKNQDQVFYDYLIGLSAPVLDPSLGYDIISLSFLQEMYTGLVEMRRPNLEVMPDAARSWEIQADGKRYLFYLREDSYWSDGVQVTAHDFVYAWERALDPALESPAAHLLFDISGAKAFHRGEEKSIGVKALDDFTLEVELEKPAGYFLPLLTHPVFYPVPKHVVERHGATWTEPENIETNGLFILESLEPGKRVVLARNPRYQGVVAGNVGRWESKILRDEQEAIDFYRAGAVDALYLYTFNRETESQLIDEFKDEYSSTAKISYSYLGFDLASPPFDDIRVRQAFIQAVDTTAVVNQVWGPSNMPALGGLIPPAIPGHSPNIGLPYDPGHARDFLAASRYSGSPKLDDLSLLTHHEYEEIAQKLADVWAEVLGISVWVEALEFGKFFDERGNWNHQLRVGGFVPDFNDPEEMFRTESTWGGFEAPAFNETLNAARRETDQTKRVELYRQADRILIEEAAVYPFAYQSLDVISKPWVPEVGLSHKDLRYLRIGPRAAAAQTDLRSTDQPVPEIPTAHVVRDYIFGLSVPNLDPGSSADLVSGALINELFRGLVELQMPDLAVVPDAARSWDILDHGKRYIFHLNKDMLWSDGEQVTAHDFVFAWKRVLGPPMKSSLAPLLMDIQGARAFNNVTASDFGVRAIDEFTLEVELEKPNGYFLQMLTNPIFLPVPQKVIERYGDSWIDPGKIVSNGPFLLQELVPSEYVVMVRNPNYTGTFTGNVERFETRLIQRSEQAIDLYRNREVDALYLFPFPPEVESQLIEDFTEDYSPAPGTVLSYLRYNHSSAPFDDPRFREAFARAADIKTIIDQTSGRTISPAMGGLIPPGIPGHSPRLALQFDPARARQLLADAGYDHPNDVSPLSLVTHHRFGQIAQELAASWADVFGIEVDVSVIDFEELSDEIRIARSDLYIGGYGLDFPDPESLFRTLPEWGGYSSVELDQFLEQARRETNQAKRIQLYQKADQFLIETAAILPIGYRSSDSLSRPWVRSMREDYKGLKYLMVPARSESPKDEKLYQVVRDYNPDPGTPSFDPGLASDGTSLSLIQEFFRGLVELRFPDLDVLPDAARSWDVKDGGKRYVFYLQKDIFWSDGKQLTAHDFVYSWKRALDPTLDSKSAHLLFDIAGARLFHEGKGESLGVRAVDDYTLEVGLERPAGYFLQLLTHPVFRPVPGHTVKKYGNSWTDSNKIVTNGPYRLQSLSRDKEIILARNAQYTGAFPGNIGRYVLELGLDAEGAVDQYRAGELDTLLLYPYPPEVQDQLIEEFSSDSLSTGTYSSTHLQFDLSRAPFDNPRVRQAFVHASDISTLVQESSGTSVIPAFGGLIPPGVPGHTPDSGLPYNPELARRLLAESGYAGGQGLPTLKLVSHSEEGYGRITRKLANSWAEIIGVDVQVDVLDFNEYKQLDQKAGYHFVLSGYAPDFLDPEDIFRMQADRNGYASPEFTEALENARRETDQGRRIAFYRKADRILIEAAGVLPIMYYGGAIFAKPRLRGFTNGLESMKFLTVGPPPEPAPAPVTDRVLRDYNLGIAKMVIDPGLAFDFTSQRIIGDLFRGLVELRLEDMLVVPDGARSWEILDGGKRWLFHLVEDAYWSDGVQVTAHDYVFAWQRALDPALDSEAAHLLFDIVGAQEFHAGQSHAVGVQAIDQFTLEIELKKPAGYFLNLLINPVFYPVPRHVIERYRESWTEFGHIVTNGPFQLDDFQPNKEIVLRRNPNYPGEFPGNLDRYEMKLGQEPAPAVDLYRRGEVDMLYLYPYRPAEEEQIFAEFGEDYSHATSRTVFYVHFDLSQTPFQDERLRQAFVQAVDLEEAVRQVFGRHSMPGLGGMVPPGVPGHSPDIGLPYDPERARQLLAAGGYPGGEGLKGMKLLAHSELGPICIAVARYWRDELGVDVEVEVLDFQEFQHPGRSDGYPLVLNGHLPDFLDPEDAFRMLEGVNEYDEPAFRKTLEKARQETDQAQRIALYKEADRLFIEAAAAMPVAYHGADLLTRPWARGYRQSYESLKYLTVGEREAVAPVNEDLRVFRDYDGGIGIRTLDPAGESINSSARLIDQIFSGLVQLQYADKVVMPEVARTWEVLEAGKKYVFHLRDDFYWGDGVQVTARDFAYAWLRALDPEKGSGLAHLLFDIAGARDFHANKEGEIGVRVIDDFTLEVVLERPTGYFLPMLSQHIFFPIPSHEVERNGERWANPEHIVTNGPYQLEAFEPGKKIVLTPNPRYPGRISGNVDRYEFIIERSPEESIELYRSGEQDVLFIDPYSADERKQLQREFQEDLSVGNPAGLFYIRLNWSRPPFDDPRIRRAFGHSVDIESIVRQSQGIQAIPASGGFIPPTIPGHSAGIGLVYDPELARRLLAESGYPEGAGFPKTELFGEPASAPVAEALVKAWEDVLGIHVEVPVNTINSYLQAFSDLPETDYGLFDLRWILDYQDPEDLFRNEAKAVGFSDPVYLDLVEKARAETEQMKRLTLYQEADRMLINEAVIIPYTYVAHRVFKKPWVGEYNQSWFSLKDLVIGERPQSLTAVAEPESVTGETIRLEWDVPATLDPNIATDHYSMGIGRHLFSGLVKINAENEVFPNVAKSWEISSDGLQYTFRLREGVTWSDGEPVTAGDFEYAWKRLLAPEAQRDYASILFDVRGAQAYQQGNGSAEDVGVAARDEHTLVVDLETPAPYMLLLMGNSFSLPVPRHVVQQDEENWAQADRIVTNGPFRIRSYTPEDSMVFVRNPQYHGQFTGNVGKVVLQFRTEGYDIPAEFAAGRLDVVDISYFEPDTITDLQSRYADLYRSMPWLFTGAVWLNAIAPLDDRNVRQALAMAINKKQLADDLIGNTQSPALGGFAPPGMPGHSPDIGLPYDPDQAQELLAEAGYPDGRGLPELSLVAPFFGTDYFDRIVHELTRAWDETLGVKVNLKTNLTFSEYAEVIQEETPHLIAGGHIADYPDPENFFRAGVHWAVQSWKNPEYNQLLDQARTVAEQSERLELYRQADQILMESAVVIPMFYVRNHFLIHSWVKAFPVSVKGERYWDEIVVERSEKEEKPAPDSLHIPRTPVPPISGETLRLDLDAPRTLDPNKVRDLHTGDLITQLFRGLVEITPELEVLPDVARRWEISSDGLQYVFHLREDVFWSDGQPVTAHDFEFSWKRTLTPGINANANILYDVRGARSLHLEGGLADQVGVHARDDFTLVVDLEAPANYFLLLMGQEAVFPIPRHAVERDGDQWADRNRIITNGPFRPDPDSDMNLMVFVRNPKFNGRSQGNVEQIILNFHIDGYDPLAEFLAGRLDVADIVDQSPEVLARLQQEHADLYRSLPYFFIRYLSFTAMEPFDDLRVRQAFAISIDKNRLADTMGGEPGLGGIIPPGMPGFMADTSLPFDPDQARALLSEAGYPNGRGFPDVSIVTPYFGNDLFDRLTLRLVRFWEDTLGVKVKSAPGYRMEKFEQQIQSGAYQIFLNGHIADIPDPETFLGSHVPRTFEIRLPSEYEQLLEQARLMTNQKERLDAYRQLDQILKDEAAIIPLLYARQHFLVRPWVKTFPVSSLGKRYWKDVVVERPEPEEKPAPDPLPIPSTPAPPITGELLNLEWNEPNSLDPKGAEFSYSVGVVQQLFSGLIEVGPDLSIVPDVAKSWELSNDGLRYKFHLREDVFWSDGTPVTAGDFEYAWKRAMAPDAEVTSMEILADIRGARDYYQGAGTVDQVGVHVADDHTLVVELEAPVSYFLLLLGHVDTRPVPRHILELDEDGWADAGRMVSNGPFLLQSHVKGQSMTFIRNPRYHRQTEGNISQVIVKFITEDQPQIEAFENQDLDILEISYMEPEIIQKYTQRFPDGHISRQFLFSYLLWLDTGPPFDNDRVRRAFALSIDRENLAGILAAGSQLPALGGIIPPGIPGHIPKLGQSNQSELARELLAEAGYPDGSGFPVVDLVAPPLGSQFFARLANQLVATWRDTLGVTVRWGGNLSFDEYKRRAELGEPCLLAWGWIADYPDPHNYLASAVLKSVNRWHNPEYIQLIEEARGLTDQQGRLARYRRAEEILSDEAVVIPLLYSRKHFLIHPWVKEFPTSATGERYWKDIVIERK